MQGGNISPLLANIALHGLETVIGKKFPRSGSRGFQPPNVVRYADDFVTLHEELEVVKACQEVASEWLQGMGLELKPNKTRITHTLATPMGTPGFDFLGFQIRQYPAGKIRSGKDCRARWHGFKTHLTPSKAAIQRPVQTLRQTSDRHQNVEQATLLAVLHPVMIGWTQYYAHVVSARVFQTLSSRLYARLCGWAVYRHPNKKQRWIMSRYWRVDEGQGWSFQPPTGGPRLYRHESTPLRRHVQVQGSRSPYDGDWVYWSSRLGRHPEVSTRVARLLQRQHGKCGACGLFLTAKEEREVAHIIPRARGGTEAIDNLHPLHQHCHEVKTARDRAGTGPSDKRHVAEEPEERKRSRPVLAQRRGK